MPEIVVVPVLLKYAKRPELELLPMINAGVELPVKVRLLEPPTVEDAPAAR